MSWRIRPAAPADAARLALVGAATFLETFAGILDGDAIAAHCAREHAPDAYARLFGAGARAWLAEAAEGGAPIGYALLAPASLEAAAPTDLELKRIYVFSRFHGRGPAAALMAEAIAAAGDTPLWLGVYARNARAIAFYARHGFTPAGTRRFRVGDALYDDTVMVRRP